MGPRAPRPLAPPPLPPPPPPPPRQRAGSSALRPGHCWPLLLLLLVNAAAARAHGYGHGKGKEPTCDQDVCTRAYDESLERRGLSGPESSTAFCGVLYDFGECMYKIRASCKGELSYHTSNSMLIHLKTRFKCVKRLPNRKNGRPAAPAASTAAPTVPGADVGVSSTTPGPAGGDGPGDSVTAEPECGYRGSRTFRHCGLFGDPHLRTFSGGMQTCRVQGAWPLVDNPYFAVQVTNEPVPPQYSKATATTKVTVLVKASDKECHPNRTKTYEATADAPLPDSFIDGTNSSGRGDAVTVRYREAPIFGASVIIHIRYIETTVVIRKVGDYLAFSTRMPEDLVSASGQGAVANYGGELCVQGCPKSEIMDLERDRGHVLSWTDALVKCASKTPKANEMLGELTDQYLDWCVFDLMTTGREDFALAAHAALRDTLAMDPSAANNLRDRTANQDLGILWDGAEASMIGGGAAPAAAAATPAALLLPLLLLAAPWGRPA